MRRALEYGFVVLPRDIGGALLLGVVIAGVIGAVVPQHGWGDYLGSGILSIVAMMLLGIPLYVCASASVPIAAGLIYAGASPGAALAFLISGPASNPATLTTVWKLLGKRTTVLYLLAVVISAIGGGLLLDWLRPAIPPLTAHAAHAHGTQAGIFPAIWAIALLAVVGYSYLKRPAVEPYPGRAAEAEAGAPPESLELAVTGMTCEHCVAAVTRALRECPGVTSVKVDLAAGRAVVTGENLDPGRLIAAVAAVGYTAKAL